jgi:hypothetical protein
MPERHSKVIHYSVSMPRYIALMLSVWVLLVAMTLRAQAETSAPMATNQASANQTIGHIDAVHALIDRHVSAIRTRDATQAYQLISQNGQLRYGTPKTYWRDVRQNMRLLFNHNSYSFLGNNQVNDMLIQKVNMIDKDGKENLVIFRLKQDSNMSWRIENVIITSNGDSIA